MPYSWRPLLAGDSAAQARDAVRAIAADLAVQAEAPGPTIAGGDSGLAVFYAYLEDALPGEGFGRRAEETLERAMEALESQSLSPCLYSGFPGIAFAVEHLQRRFYGGEDDEDLNEAIDELLAERLAAGGWRREYDLIYGLVGLGVYALERLPRTSAAVCLARVVDRIEELAVHTAAGVTWHTPRQLLGAGTYLQAADGIFNLGMAHGIPGVIALLAEAVAAGVEAGRARALLAGAVSWLLAQKLPPGFGSTFSGAVGDGLGPERSRLGWCYGDLGIAAALLLAARAASEPDWEREALEIARRSARRRSTEDSDVVDSGLCHGAAGVAHVFDRLFQATGEAELGNAARWWYEWMLDARRPGQGIGGFRAWEPETPDGPFFWRSNPGFLSGAAGIGLALLAAVSPREPAWDRLLLTAIPPRGGAVEAADGGPR